MRTLRRMKIEIYGHDDCPYCLNSKALLQDKGWNYIYYDIKCHPERDVELLNRLKDFGIMKKISIPQIFINNDLIGGYVDLVSYLQAIDNGKNV